MKKSREDYARDWFARARSDLKIARREIVAPDPAADAVCFHFQQAVEKMLKRWLVWREQEFPRTHNLAALVELAERLDSEFAELRRVAPLTAYAVDSRYPESPYLPGVDDMRAAAELASAAESFIRERFRREGFDPDQL
jgi:HEPN domain-containing protein